MERIAKFEKVSFEQYSEAVRGIAPERSDEEIRSLYNGIKLPKRATEGSAGYDFYAPERVVLAPGEQILIPTGIRVRIEAGYVLMLFPRSGLGFKLYTRLANTVGNIDSDYYGADNEGHIMVKLRMETAGGEPRTFEAGTAVCQGVFVPFGITEDDGATEKRTGGFGSTGK